MILHWLVGPHPWVKRHLRGLYWLLTALAWMLGAALVALAAVGPVHDGCTGPHVYQCAEGVTAANLFGGIAWVAAAICTIAMLWTAEERRINPPAEAEREDRAARIRRMEQEAGIA